MEKEIKAIEEGTGKSVITSQNAAQLNQVVTQMIEAGAGAADGKSEGKEEKKKE